ncbi:uncharacterized protein TNCV_1905681 [Trichonephila clavipes]|nr:uncharacterized protein TNCV_1905681 [Trichonephila clavipes]
MEYREKFLIIFLSKKEFQRSCRSPKQKKKLDTTNRGDLRSDTAFNEMLCDARELADEFNILANFELTQPRHRVRKRNANFDYEAQDDPIEDPSLKYKAEFYFSH